jgi:thiamine kinase
VTPERALAEIGDLVAGARVVGPLAGGPASRSFLVERGDDRWVLRVDTVAATALGLDRGGEAYVLGHVDAEGLGPRLEFLDADRGIQLVRCIPGRAWTVADLEAPGNVARLAALLRRVHAVDIAAQPLALRERVAHYAALAGTPRAGERALRIRELLERLPEHAPCLCHNDVVCANVIAGDRLYLVDWEYAARGDPFFDLATIVRHHALSDELAAELLRAYVGALRGDDVRRLRGWCDLYEHLLALWQEAVDALAGG